ncbi:hypothetical protein B0H12DRAFT_1140421 [Mycena haematopus]|nr:hypothetical protein B0H12DRAFT_1140421 [Mycena haematopus]
MKRFAGLPSIIDLNLFRTKGRTDGERPIKSACLRRLKKDIIQRKCEVHGAHDRNPTHVDEATRIEYLDPLYWLLHEGTGSADISCVQNSN